MHQSFEWVVGSVPVAEGQQGWILPPHQPHLVLLGPDELALPSGAEKDTDNTLHIGHLTLSSLTELLK